MLALIIKSIIPTNQNSLKNNNEAWQVRAFSLHNTLKISLLNKRIKKRIKESENMLFVALFFVYPESYLKIFFKKNIGRAHQIIKRHFKGFGQLRSHLNGRFYFVLHL